MVDSLTGVTSDGITLNIPQILGVFEEYATAKQFLRKFIPNAYANDFDDEFEDMGKVMTLQIAGGIMYITIKTRTVNNENQYLE